MARLDRGENTKIDYINDLVATFKNDDTTKEQKNECITILLNMFKPLILKLCKKWSDYFNDHSHNIKSFDEIIIDAEYWFVYYTQYKYIIDGVATFNTFIKNHLDQRIRYIYESEIKYYSKLIFPDPDKRSDAEGISAFEDVIYNYKSDINEDDLEVCILEQYENISREELAHKIMDIVGTNNIFNDRERKIFNEIICNGITHDEMGKRLNISRTRVSQILRKVKIKLYKIMNSDQEIWNMVIKADIDFEEI